MQYHYYMEERQAYSQTALKFQLKLHGRIEDANYLEA